MYILTAIAYIVYPLVTYLLANELVSILPLAFPFADENTQFGYIAKFLTEVCEIVGAVTASSTTDLTFATIIINAHALAYIFSASVRDLNNEMAKGKSAVNVAKVYFRNSLFQNRELVE